MSDDYAVYRFFGDLNDFVSTEPQQPIRLALNGTESVKHPIESLGVPHPEVGRIDVNGRPVPFGYRVQHTDRVDVFPWPHSLPTGHPGSLRAPAPHPLRFVLDTHLGQLARYLRLFGTDSLYENDYDDPVLARISADEQRFLLTRDRELLKRRTVVYGHCVRATEPRLQLLAVIQRFGLLDEFSPWRRCLRCNGLLVPVEKEAVHAILEPKTRRYYQEFQQCSACGRVYWRGSHFERLQAFVDEIVAACQC